MSWGDPTPAGNNPLPGARPLAPRPLPAGGAIQPAPNRPLAAPRPQAIGPPAGVVPGAAPGGPARPIRVKAEQASLLIRTKSDDDADADAETRTIQQFIRNAPAWLVSTVIHTVVLIILGLFLTRVVRTRPVIEIAPAEQFAEQIGDQLDDASVLEAGSGELDEGPKQMITQDGLPPVDDPFAAPPAPIEAMEPGDSGAFSNIDAPVIGMALSGRQVGSRTVLLKRYGGNATTEAAVDRGLQWLKKQQKGDGTWSLGGPYADGSLEENTGAATAMALLAFQGAGNTHMKGAYSKEVAKGWNALLKLQSPEGDFFKAYDGRHRLYMQGQCMIALCEIFGMTGDSKFHEPALRAVKFAIKSQTKEGGWRYEVGVDSDTSVTGWFVMGLQSARMAKLEVPQETFDRITKYLDSAEAAGGREYRYTPDYAATRAISAEGLLCRQYLGWKQNDQRLIEGVADFCNHPVNYAGDDADLYYWYYATQACHHMEDVAEVDRKPVVHKIWDRWNTVMRQEVPAHQLRDGAEAGSWTPRGDKWAANGGGRLYATCLSLFMLEVYYRHLPLYSGYKAKGMLTSAE